MDDNGLRCCLRNMGLRRFLGHDSQSRYLCKEHRNCLRRELTCSEEVCCYSVRFFRISNILKQQVNNTNKTYCRVAWSPWIGNRIKSQWLNLAGSNLSTS